MKKRTHMPLEERCKQVVEFIENFYFRNASWPVYRVIMKGIGIKSLGHMKIIVDELLGDGKLEREPGTSNRLRLPNHSLFSLPLKGFIAANNINPEMVLDEDPHATFELLKELIPAKTDRSKIYALKVNGNSMQKAMIADGDTVLMEQGDTYNEGDIVAIYFINEGAVTLKRIYQGRPGVIKLKAESHRHHTRVEKQEDIKVLGRIVGVIRKYS